MLPFQASRGGIQLQTSEKTCTFRSEEFDKQKDTKKPLGIQRFITIIILGYVCLSGSFSDVMAENKTDARPDHSISLLPVDEIDDEVLEMLRNRLTETFGCDVKIRDGLNIPPDAYSPQRKQYLSSLILDELHKHILPSKEGKFLAITGVDLYVPQLNFVFGEAEIRGQFAIISLARLHQSFYGLPEDRGLFQERAVKEAVHELGHTFGLRHCPDPECVMHFSNSLLDTDRKKAIFCSRCQKLLEEETGFE